jgi:tripartite-type tricarboxylate transporter receptor subunit TctC
MCREVRRLVVATLAAVWAYAPNAIGAEPYPSQAIRIVVGQAPGGQSDVVARAIGQRLGDSLRTPVVIVNNGGLGGTLGAEAVARAPADGYTLLLGGTNNLAIAPALMAALPYLPSRDFVPIGGIARVAYALAVRADLPVRSLGELIAYARANPDRLNFGSGGNGSTSALGAEMLMAATGIRMVQIPYKGTAPAIVELVAGRIDLMFADLAQLLPHAKTGSLRLVAAAGTTRSPLAPELRTLGEQGVAGVAVEPWYGLLAPAGTPDNAIAALTDATLAISRDPAFRQRLSSLGYDPFDNERETLRALIAADLERYQAIVRRAGIKPSP